MKKFHFLSILFEYIEEGITLFFFVVMCYFVFIQVFFRFVLNNPLLYPEEISRAAYVWLTFIGMSLVTKTRENIRVDFFVELLPDVIRKCARLMVDFTVLLLIIFLGWVGFRFVIFSRLSITPALEVPMNLLYISFPIGCFLSVVRLIINMVADLRQLLSPGSGNGSVNPTV